MCAQRLGERLLGEVTVEGLGELLSSLRYLSTLGTTMSYFGIPELDALLPEHPLAPASLPAQQQPQLTQSRQPNPFPPNLGPPPPPAQNSPVPKISAPKCPGPIIELISPPPSHHPSGSGKTSLIYLITALAILPPTLSSAQLGGKNAAIVLLDPLSHFSVSRLAQVCISLICSKFREAEEVTDGNRQGGVGVVKNEVKQCVKRALTHVHIFRPQSWDSLMEMLETLPEYLFDGEGSKHQSIGRRIHAIIIEGVDAFYWTMRADAETVIPESKTMSANPIAKVASESSKFTAGLEKLSHMLSCAVILSSHSITMIHPFRTPFPMSWPSGTTSTRLAVRRVDVNKFAPAISVEEAEMERLQRWEVVSQGRFECWRVKLGVRDGDGFVFKAEVGGDGVWVEQDDG
ncbi:uncharacterized protein BDR25DRAFT_251739 [Lindgomyces ingoldianus]|uniref:Uncharacterized protein n=1 Tax=Lindgomyces ingoldianus TaxID=673940 RepID=A0ACB6RDE5_9PLEO|nr:uncharacterized protein BDR25DRAFT_251739 [Lindgomyces ingoldianus]KAF2477161.1 hypothetical protein BDR25DRAFT_251739 [Lindgomyces ingoldianus]